MTKLRRMMKKKKINPKVKWVLVPVNIERSHWFLLAIQLTSGIAVVIDSMFGGRVD